MNQTTVRRRAEESQVDVIAMAHELAARIESDRRDYICQLARIVLCARAGQETTR